jgi:polysaccharide pyruvyl transferase WcaK-like protein
VNILHVASFVGNIGDNASHMGLRKVLGRVVPDFKVTRMEMRKFYKSYKGRDSKAFDRDFVEYANTFDLLVIGGGGFLDFWVPGSRTGTTIDIGADDIARVSVRTLITSVGSIPHRGVPQGNIEKFKRFLSACGENHKISIALRNDGSREVMRSHVGEEFAAMTTEVLDSGFFLDERGAGASCSDFGKSFILINVCDDQLRMFRQTGAIDSGRFYTGIARAVEYLADAYESNIVFAPHIHGDLRAIGSVIERLNDFLARERVSVAPSVQGDEGARMIFGLYRRARLVIGTRFHSNVCSLAMGVPVIGIEVLDRVRWMYESLGLKDRSVRLGEDFDACLIERLDRALEEPGAFSRGGKLDELRQKTESFYRGAIEA